MEFLARKDAVAAGSRKYFTGKPCKHGHIAERYTDSGTCSVCINGNRPSVAVTPLTHGTPEQREQAQEIVDLKDSKFWLYDVDYVAFKKVAIGMLRARYPLVPPAAFEVKPIPSRPIQGTSLYRVKHHPDDGDFLVAYAMGLRQPHQPTADQMAVIREQIHRRADSDYGPRPELLYDYDKVNTK